MPGNPTRTFRLRAIPVQTLAAETQGPRRLAPATNSRASVFFRQCGGNGRDL
jgi:hypothetical protein